MFEVIAAIAPLGVLVGVALGWYLRRVNSWCPECGCALSCPGCGRRPALVQPHHESHHHEHEHEGVQR